MDNPKKPGVQIVSETVKPAAPNFEPEESMVRGVGKSRDKPRLKDETIEIQEQGKHQQLIANDYKELKKKYSVEKDETTNASSSSQPKTNPPKSATKAGSKIGNLVKGALNGATKALTFLGRINLVLGPATIILESKNTVDEATEQAALQAYSEQKGNQFAQSQEKATSVTIAKDDEPTIANSGVVTIPEGGVENINAPSSYNQLDQDAVISSMQAGYDINSDTSGDAPTIDDAERDGVLTAMASGYTDNEDVGSFYWEAPSIDVDMDVDGGGTSDSGGDGGGDD